MFRLQNITIPQSTDNIQGTEDPVFPAKFAAEQIKLFKSSAEATFTVVEGGGHYLNATSPKEIEEAILKMTSKYA